MLLFLTIALLLQTPQWTPQSSGVKARLRGVSAVNARVAWASGAESTVLRTTDGGATWQKVTVTTEQLDFRDVDAINEQTAFVLAIGNGPASRIYKTTDGGATWSLQFKNDEPKAFLDAMSFWDAKHGIAIGDSVDGKLYIMTTENGGAEWKRVPSTSLPPALENEGAFAASGTNIAVVGNSHAWIATGAAAKSRVLQTTDRGRTWKVAETPIGSGPSSGIFSIAFRDNKHGVVVGGDYRKENEAVANLAFTEDGGETWKLMPGLSGYRSVVAYVRAGSGIGIVAVGPTGADYSRDDGRTWTPVEGLKFDTLSFAPGKRTMVAWAAGANGSIGKVTFEPIEKLLDTEGVKRK